MTHELIDDLATAAGYPGDPSVFRSLDTRANETYRPVVPFLADTGVRFGEMAALRVAQLPGRSAFPTFTRTSCGTPRPASPSPAAPTSRSSG